MIPVTPREPTGVPRIGSWAATMGKVGRTKKLMAQNVQRARPRKRPMNLNMAIISVAIPVVTLARNVWRWDRFDLPRCVVDTLLGLTRLARFIVPFVRSVQQTRFSFLGDGTFHARDSL